MSALTVIMSVPVPSIMTSLPGAAVEQVMAGLAIEYSGSTRGSIQSSNAVTVSALLALLPTLSSPTGLVAAEMMVFVVIVVTYGDDHPHDSEYAACTGL
jgi:formate hydrogenlyase subunit 4